MHVDFQHRTDSTQRLWRKWTFLALVLTALAFSLYAILFHVRQIRLSGGTIPGLVFGSAGYFLILYAGALSLRKKLPKMMYWLIFSLRRRFPNWKRLPQFSTWRLAPVRKMMRAHLWLGLFSYPIVIFHAGFTYGSGLAFVLMWLLTVVVLTGIWGAILQHFMPRLMTEDVQRETIYSGIGRELKWLSKRAESLIAHLRPSNDLYAFRPQQSGKLTSPRVATMVIRIDQEAGKKLRHDYDNHIRPYLAHRGTYRDLLRDPKAAKMLFDSLRIIMPDQVQPAIAELEDICDQKRNLDRQSSMHRWLHGWLLLHVPLSALLIVLGALHAWKAMRNG